MERKLATIQVISELHPINGADKIELALMQNLGWECVIKKGEFKVGDKIIYCEVDSILPERPEYEFLRDRKFRVKTIKLKGQVSQGLILPISLLNLNQKDLDSGNIGMDVTEALGITKYLTPSEREEFAQQERKITDEKNKLKKFLMRYSWFRKLFLSKNKKSEWPYWISKTDEERVQNLNYQEVLRKFGDKEVYVTEKIDYQSATFTGRIVPRFNNWFGIKMFNLINKI